LVQRCSDGHHVDYVPAYDRGHSSFWSHWDPTRIAIPRYQNLIRIVIWFFFLFVYSQAVREPLDRLDPLLSHLDFWEIALYFMALTFLVEDLYSVSKILRFATWRAFGFWHSVAIVTDMLLLTAFILRASGLVSHEGNRDQLFLRSFQVLSFVSPLIWMKLITVFDGLKYVGTMQICVARMFQESGIFFGLLSIMGIGFLQGLYALDAADGQIESSTDVMHVMVQSLLQAPNYDKFAGSPAGITLYYFWNVVTALVLINVLISLFSSAYSDVVGDAEAEYLSFFAGKTVSMFRAPDTYVYPAPFNLVEILFIAPFESILSPPSYAKLNRLFMTVLFFIPMMVIALYESTPWKKNWLDDFIDLTPLDADDSPDARDPDVDGEDARNGIVISTVPFSELVKAFPNTYESGEANIVKEIHELKKQLNTLIGSLDEKKT